MDPNNLCYCHTYVTFYFFLYMSSICLFFFSLYVFFSACPHVTFYKTLTPLSTGHVRFLQLLKWSYITLHFLPICAYGALALVCSLLLCICVCICHCVCPCDEYAKKYWNDQFFFGGGGWDLWLSEETIRFWKKSPQHKVRVRGGWGCRVEILAQW